VTDQVVHPYKTTGKVTILHISVPIFLENQWEYKILDFMVLQVALKTDILHLLMYALEQYEQDLTLSTVCSVRVHHVRQSCDNNI